MTVWHDSPFRPTDPAAIDDTLVDALRTASCRHPRRTAIVDGERSIDWQTFASIVGGLAREIARADARPGPVALLQHAGVTATAAWFACAAAGRPLLLLEPGNPTARNRQLIEAAGAAIVIHDDAEAVADFGILPLLASTCDPAPLDRSGGLHPDDVAMIFPTSGSTGQPKLIAYGSRTMQVKVQASIALMGIAPGDRVLIAGSHANFGYMHHALAFLLAGGSVCIADVRQLGLTGALGMIGSSGVRHVRFTPSLFRVASAHPSLAGDLALLRGVRFSGEPLLGDDLRLARRVLHPECVIQNVYGSTESGIFIWTDDGSDQPHTVPIGRIYPGWQYGIQHDGSSADAGDGTGELVIRSAHHALGDWTIGGIDPSRFPVDPAEPSLRLYRTGDIVRHGPADDLVLLGRSDQIVKVNGMRVSLPEIEAELRRVPGCGDAKVLHVAGAKGDRLLAFAIRDGSEVAVAPAHWLAERLPAHMRPARIVWVDAMPLLPGGKVDRLALLAMAKADDDAAHTEDASGTTGGSAAFSRLSAMWCDVLELRSCRPDADFFSIGGDSLRMIDLLLAVEEGVGVAIPPEAFARQPTLRNLASMAGIAIIYEGAAPACHVDGLVFRCVRSGGVGAAIALCMPGIDGRAHPEPFLAAGAFADFDIWTCDADRPDSAFLKRGKWIEAAQQAARAIAAGDIPAPAVVFGYSLAGYIAWLTDRMLADDPHRPKHVVCIDAPMLHRDPIHGRRSLRRLVCGLRPTPGRVLHVTRSQPGPLHLRRLLRPDWPPTQEGATSIRIGTIDHLDMGKARAIASVTPFIDDFVRGDEVTHRIEPIDHGGTLGGKLANWFAGRRPHNAEHTMSSLAAEGFATALWPAVLYVLLAAGDRHDVGKVLDAAIIHHPSRATLRYARRRLRRCADLPAPGGRECAAEGNTISLISFAAVDRALTLRDGNRRNALDTWIDRLRASTAALAVSPRVLTRIWRELPRR